MSAARYRERWQGFGRRAIGPFDLKRVRGGWQISQKGNRVGFAPTLADARIAVRAWIG